MTHLAHYYHIGTRSSRVRNYTIGPMTSARCPSCNYRGLMTLLIGSNDGGVYRHPGCCGGHITPDRSPPRSCGIINPINACDSTVRTIDRYTIDRYAIDRYTVDRYTPHTVLSHSHVLYIWYTVLTMYIPCFPC